MHVLVGPLSAAIGYAVAPYVDGKKMPTIFPIVSAEDITQRKRSPYIVRTGWSSAQPSHPFGKWVVRQPRLQEDRHDRLRLRIRLGGGGGLPAHLRGGGRPGRAEALAPARQRGLRALSRPAPPRRGRGLLRLLGRGRPALLQAVHGGRAQGEAAAHRRRHLHRRARAAQHGRRGAGGGHRAPLLGGDHHARPIASSPRPTRPSSSRRRRITRRAPTWRASP